MLAATLQDDGRTRRQLLLLLAASIAVVLCLVASAETAVQPEPRFQFVSQLGVLALVAAAASGVAFLVWRTTSQSVVRAAALERELREARRALASTEAIIKAEQQVLVFWDHGLKARVVAHSLGEVAGVPSAESDILKFGAWLDSKAAVELKGALDQLFLQGTSFNLLLKTLAGAHIEADGRAAGGRAVLRFRDVAGHKRDLIRIIEQHRQLTRDIRASRMLLDALPLPVWLRDKDGRLEWVNAAYIKAVDAESFAEVIDRQMELLEAHQRADIGRAVRQGQTYRKNAHIVVGGERRPHDIVALPADDASAGAALDVTTLELVRGELDRRVAAYDRTLDKVATAVASFGKDQRLIFFNEAYARLWQLDRAWLSSKPTDAEIIDRLRGLSRLPSQANYRDWKSKLLAIYKTGVSREDWWHLPDGRMLRVDAELRPDGGVTYIYDDFSERLQLESRYKTMINVQRETLDSLKEGVAVFGPDGRLKLSNSVFAAIWRLSPTLLGQSPHVDEFVKQGRVLYEDDRTWNQIKTAVTAVAEERESLEGQMVRVDGSVIRYTATPLPDGATLIAFQDVTAAKQYEKALIERNEALVAADRLKNQFIGHVSYELRTPLTNIIGFSEMLANPRTGPLTEKQREYLGDITGSSRTLLSIINDILDLATIDAGTLELKRAPVDVRTVVEDTARALRDRAAQARVRVAINIAPDVAQVLADEARLRQVLYNLLSNAIGFSNSNGIVKIACQRQLRMVAFTVEDEGAGIPSSDLDRIFGRFETRSQGSRHRGAGLGLSIAKSLVELHGGDMAMESQPGRGTRVTVRIPEYSVDQPPGPVIARSA